MQADRLRLRRWAQLFLVLGTVSAASAFPVTAYADDDDEEEEEEDEEEEDDEEEDEEQPPVTAGGLYTKETYPVSEIERPLTITGGMTELRLGIDVDVSAAAAFEKWGLGFDARHGFADNVEGQFHLRSDLNEFSSFVAEAAIEAGIVYDIVDFRLALSVPYSKTAPVPPATESTSTTGFDIAFGFPFRYAVKPPQVALIALDTFMTINTDSKPDLTPSVGVIVQPVAMLALILNAKLIIKDFNTDAGNFQIPVSLDIQFSPSNKFDLGGEFTFPNLKPADPDADGPLEAPKFYDNRMLLLYGQLRI